MRFRLSTALWVVALLALLAAWFADRQRLETRETMAIEQRDELQREVQRLRQKVFEAQTAEIRAVARGQDRQR